MLNAVCRYGARWPRDFEGIVERCRRAGTDVRGPEIGAFEEALARRLGGGRAVTASHGRMAAWYIFRALDLPPDSEVVFPALTFWVVPEMARAAGLRPVFADVDPATFNLHPAALQKALSPRTRAVVPTHVYGLPCDMREILAIARARGLRVVEDCAHALGATYRGRPVGAFGDAALFSFQVLKPLNTCGGGAAYTRHPALGARIAALAGQEPWPAPREVRRRIRLARLERALMRPRVFSASVYPLLWLASWLRARPDVYLWEPVRPLGPPLPRHYRERYSNTQAALGLAGLDELDGWIRTTRRNATVLRTPLSGLPGVSLPLAPWDRLHVYYQFCVHVEDRDAVVRGCLRRGLDVESHHMDVCPDLGLFAEERSAAFPGARRASLALQLPVHASLSEKDLDRIAARAYSVLAGPPSPARPPTREVPS